MKVLFIKLNTRYIKQFAKVLIHSGKEFGFIDSYYEALKILDNNQYDLIITDIDNPPNYKDISSNNFFSELYNSNEKHKNISIMTSHIDGSVLNEYIERGILGIIYKNENIHEVTKQFCFILNAVF